MGERTARSGPGPGPGPDPPEYRPDGCGRCEEAGHYQRRKVRRRPWQEAEAAPRRHGGRESLDAGPDAGRQECND